MHNQTAAHCAPCEWRKHFNENMEALGLPIPSGLFATLLLTGQYITTAESLLNSLGPKATVQELLFATKKVEKIKLGTNLYAGYYLGAVIGSAAVATGKVIGESTTISNIYFMLNKNKYAFINVPVFYQNHKEIILTDMINRGRYVNKALIRQSNPFAAKAVFPY